MHPRKAGTSVFTKLKNLVVCNKTNCCAGALCRSKHKQIFVFKQGTVEHTNSFDLGETEQYQTNVWDYAGILSISVSRSEELAMHPTVKPVALIADAIRDCSRRGEVVLDCFGGSGSTLIAAEKTGRCARLIEYDPPYPAWPRPSRHSPLPPAGALALKVPAASIMHMRYCRGVLPNQRPQARLSAA